MRVATIAVLILLAGPGAAWADGFCSAPLTDWRPREALLSQLEAEGWTDIAIRIEDGCYLVHAHNAQGERLHGKFDPATLAPLRRDHDRHDEEGRGSRSSKD
jgi:hypothetical protein